MKMGIKYSMLEFEILVQGLYRQDQFTIVYNPTLRMPKTAEIERWMESLWQEKLAQAKVQGTRLFDAPLFRFVSAQSTGAQLTLTIGDTSYKEYVTTRTPEFTRAHPRQDLGNALSVCSVIETSDEVILLEKRQGVDVYVGRYHVIGGFFERMLDTDQGKQPDPFAAMRREIREETGIQADDIRDQHCLGIVYDVTTPHAELCFLTRLHIPLAEVQKRQPEDQEIQHLLSLPITAESLRAFLLAHHGNISATGEPNLILYGGWKFGVGWYEDVMRQLIG
jgi:8-oxo-dGTP pyrophosphatase MutT (NUDIX family)